MIPDRIVRHRFQQAKVQIASTAGIGSEFINLAQTQGCQRAAASITSGPGLVMARFALDFESSATMISTRLGRVLTALRPAKYQNVDILGVSNMKIRPLHDRVIVKRLEEERTSPGGILIPDTAAEKPIQGKVIAVGKGKILESGEVRPLDVKVGDKVLFGKYSGTEVKMDGDELVVMREEDIMAVIESK
jgi:chaperonin GroES